MSAPTSPHNKRKQLACKVLLLDDTVQTFYLPVKSTGEVLYEEVVRRLQLLESDYFDIAYTDVQGVTCWLDHEKQIVRQVPHHNLEFRFIVKFYSPDPGLLEEEYTRYLFALQVKRDLSTGAMPCQEHTAVLLASFIVQGMFGDFSEEEFAVPGYLKQVKLLPVQTDEIEVKIAEHHREHFGQSPADADFNLLETARKVELYGIQMHPAKDHESVSLHLAVAHMGVLVFQNMTKINTFSWAKIRKLSFKRKKFLIKLHPEGYGYYKDTVEFYFDTRNECKNFWKKCLEHHAFFRCHAVKRLPRNKTRVVSRGSSFRYSGRTQKQLIEYVRENYVKRPPFQRSTSMRTMSAGATPRTGTLNSRDLHLSHNTSMSSASHLITPAAPPSDRSSLTVTGGVTSSAVGDGKRSLSVTGRDERSGTLERSARAAGHLTEVGGGVRQEVDVNHVEVEMSTTAGGLMSAEHRPGGSPANVSQQDKIDMSQFILARNRNCSSPEVIAAATEDDDVESKNKNMLPRSEEVEDIPTHLIEKKQNLMAVPPRHLIHSQSATVPDHTEERSQGALGLSRSPKPEPAPRRFVDQFQLDLNQSEESELNLTAAAAAAALEQRSPGPSSPRSPRSPRSPEVNSRPIVFEINQHSDSLNDVARSNTSIEYRRPQQPPPSSSSPVGMNNTPSPRPRQLSSDESTGALPSLTTVTYTSSGSIASVRTEGSQQHGQQRKKIKPGRAYYIAKELVMTERTYVKDLSVISVWFRNAISQGNIPVSHSVTDTLLESFDGLYEFHCQLLKQIEQRLSMWESQETSGVVNQQQCRMGDLILDNLDVLQKYEEYMNDVETLLRNLDSLCKEDRGFEQVYREFEMQKVCYLPLNTFLLKPLHRLLHYHLIVDRFLQLYPNGHPDVSDLLSASNQLNALIKMYSGQLPYLDNLQKLIELQQDLVGINNLLQPNREFIREGCLQKLSRKGYQQRMFFLFSDVLLYTSRLATQSLLFRVHGQLPVQGMTIEETDNKIAVNNSFAVYSGSRCLLVAASSESEKAKWMEDIQRAIIAAGCASPNSNGKNQERAVLYPSLKSNNSSEATDDTFEDQINLAAIDRGQIQHRTNTLMHVCWHRNTSVSMKERSIANRKLLSGFLLRKFKTNNDWQRLWVVFTNFCLFFYKSYRDDFPLASLPLLGYSVQMPAATDNIKEELCFKLQFKNHIYFFRAESQYTFERWMEVISAATGTSHHMRLFSRLDSEGTNSMPSGQHIDF